jgi:hypothetical protein
MASMSYPRRFTVRWILLLRDEQRGGLYGTTTHEAASPASAAVASAEAILKAVNTEARPQEIHVLGVFDEPTEANLLSEKDLAAALRFHYRPLPCQVAYRPLC